jgi:hypothetical protein
MDTDSHGLGWGKRKISHGFQSLIFREFPFSLGKNLFIRVHLYSSVVSTVGGAVVGQKDSCR